MIRVARLLEPGRVFVVEPRGRFHNVLNALGGTGRCAVAKAAQSNCEFGIITANVFSRANFGV